MLDTQVKAAKQASLLAWEKNAGCFWQYKSVKHGESKGQKTPKLTKIISLLLTVIVKMAVSLAKIQISFWKTVFI